MSKLTQVTKEVAKKYIDDFYKQYPEFGRGQDDADELGGKDSLFYNSVSEILTRFAEEVEREVIEPDILPRSLTVDDLKNSSVSGIINHTKASQRQKLATLLTQWKGEDEKTN